MSNDNVTRLEPVPSPRNAPGNGGNEGDGDLGARVARLETRMDYLATKEDIANIRGDIANMKSSYIQWTVFTIIAVVGLLVTYLRATG